MGLCRITNALTGFRHSHHTSLRMRLLPGALPAAPAALHPRRQTNSLDWSPQFSRPDTIGIRPHPSHPLSQHKTQQPPITDSRSARAQSGRTEWPLHSAMVCSTELFFFSSTRRGTRSDVDVFPPSVAVVFCSRLSRSRPPTRMRTISPMSSFSLSSCLYLVSVSRTNRLPSSMA